MNRVYKVIRRPGTNQWVVASELAKGAKKGDSRGMVKKIIAASLVAGSLLGVGVAQVTEHSLQDQYRPSKRTDHADGSVTFETLSNHKNHAIKVNDGGEHLLNNYNPSDTQIDKENLNVQLETTRKTYGTLVDEGSLVVYKAEDWDSKLKQPKEGATPLSKEEALELGKNGTPPIQRYELAQNGTFKFIDESGAERVVEKLGVKEYNGGIGVYHNVDIASKVPDEPFYDLSFAEVTDGTLTLDSGKKEEIKWDFKDTGIKNSALFTADSTVSGEKATIIVSKNTDITVDFSTTGETLEEGDFKVEPHADEIKRNSVKKFIHDVDPDKPPLEVTYREGGITKTEKFWVKDVESFNKYNDFIIELIRSNQINQDQYKKLVDNQKVFIESSIPLYVKHYTGGGNNNAEYLTDAHKLTGKNAIFKASGKDASIIIEEGAKLFSEATIDGRSTGRVLQLEDGATGVDSAHNIVGRGGNVDINGGSSYTQKGTKVFGYNQVDGKYREDENERVFSVEENIDSGKYINEGKIFSNIEKTFSLNKGNSELLNNGEMHFYSAYTTDQNGNKNGNDKLLKNIELNWGGTFVNGEHGKITLGIGYNDAGEEIGLRNKRGKNDDGHFLTKDVHNIIHVADGSGDFRNGHIDNKGHIQIGVKPKTGTPDEELFANAVAINIGKRVVDTSSVTNSGVIDLGGEETLGIRVARGDGKDRGNVGNTGTINVHGRNSIGMLGLSNSVLYHKGEGVINVGNSEDKKENIRRTGIQVEEGSRVLLQGKSKVNLVGDNAIGVYARNGGKIEISDQAAVLGLGNKDQFTNQTLFWTSGFDVKQGNSSVSFAEGNPTFNLNAQKSTVFRVDGKGYFGVDSNTANPSEYTINVHGTESRGFYIADAGTKVLADGSINLNVLGDGATGFFVTSGAGFDDVGNEDGERVKLTEDVEISLKGEKATAMTVDGNYYDLYGNPREVNGKKHTLTIAHSSAQLDTQNVDTTKGAYGYKLINEGKLIHSGSIDFSDAKDAIGIYVNGGQLENQQGSKVVVNGVGLDLYQDNEHNLASIVETEGDIVATDGTAAIRMNENTELTLSGEGTVEGAGKADGVLVHKGAALALNAANNLKVSGTEGSALHFQTANEAGAFQLENASGQILVSGEKGSNVAAITIEGEGANREGVIGQSDFDSKVLNDIEITVEEGRGGHAVVTNLAGTITIDEKTTLDVASTVGGSALKVKGASPSIENSGTLSSSSTEAPVIDARELEADGALRVDNKGSIKALADDGLAFASTKQTQLTNHEKAEIQGTVQLGDQGNVVILKGTSTGDRFFSGKGDDHFILDEVVGTEASRDLFTKLDGGQGEDTLMLREKSHFVYQDGHSINNINELIVQDENWFEMNGSNPHLTFDKAIIEQGGNFSIVGGTLESAVENAGLFAVGKVALPGFKASKMGGASRAMSGPYAATVEGDFINKMGGAIDLSNRYAVTDSPIGNTLTITGDYRGEEGSSIYMNTHWDNPGDAFGADSKSDRLIIKGKTVGDGVTRVIPISRDTKEEAVIDGSIEAVADQVKNTIDVIETDGTYDGAFVGTAQTTGAGEVQLVRNNDNWRWTTNALLHQPDPKPVDPTDPIVPTAPIYDKGVPGYAQLSKVNREMGLNQLGKLHDRMGELQTYVWDCCGGYADYYKQQKELYGKEFHPIWVRGELTQLKEQGRHRLGYEVEEVLLQLGGDLRFTMDENKNHHHFGVMAGYSHGKVDFYDKFRAENGVVTTEKRSGKADIDLFTIGAYSTWYRANGAYLDLVGQLSYSHNSYKEYGGDLTQNGYGIGLSAEVGRPFQIGSSNWLIEPQAQLMYQYVHLNSADDGPRHITGQSAGTLRGRLGARLAWNGDNGKHHTNTIYASAHLLHDFNGYKSRAQIGADRIEERYARTWGEVQLGAQIATSRSTYVYGSVGYQRAIGGHKNRTHRSNERSREGFKGYLGIRFNF